MGLELKDAGTKPSVNLIKADLLEGRGGVGHPSFHPFLYPPAPFLPQGPRAWVLPGRSLSFLRVPKSVTLHQIQTC